MTDGSDEIQQGVIDSIRRIYSGTVADHVLSPRNFGSMPHADGIGQTQEDDCGDTLKIWIRVRGDVVDQAAFWTDGCAASIACGSMAVELIEGRPVVGALQLSQGEILDALGGLPEPNVHCAEVAASTVKKAVFDYLKMKTEPWKKAYRQGYQ